MRINRIYDKIFWGFWLTFIGLGAFVNPWFFMMAGIWCVYNIIDCFYYHGKENKHD